MTTINLSLVLGVLPNNVQAMISLIGIDKTSELIKAFGGIGLYITKTKTQRGILRYKKLCEIVGEKAADKLVVAYGGQFLSIPRCHVAICELRDMHIKEEFDRRAMNELETMITADLANKYQITQRYVRKILKNNRMLA